MFGFVALIAVYFLVAGSDVTDRAVWKLMLVYILGASIAFWVGGDPIGTFRRISVRPLCILLGAVMMIYGISMTLFVKEAIHKNGRAPNKSLQPTPGRRCSSAARFPSLGPAWLSSDR